MLLVQELKNLSSYKLESFSNSIHQRGRMLPFLLRYFVISALKIKKAIDRARAVQCSSIPFQSTKSYNLAARQALLGFYSR